MSEDQARKNICVSNANKLLNELVEAINEAFGEGVKIEFSVGFDGEKSYVSRFDAWEKLKVS